MEATNFRKVIELIMSDNNRNGGKKDNFAKPGDESIVSGKSFFLSFGKTPKGPANPLLESEKRKSDADKGERDAKKFPKHNDKKDRNKDKHRKDDIRQDSVKAQDNSKAEANKGKSPDGANTPDNSRHGDFKKHGKGKHGRHDRRHKGARDTINAPQEAAQPTGKNDALREKFGKDTRPDKKVHGKGDRPDRRDERQQGNKNGEHREKFGGNRPVNGAKMQPQTRDAQMHSEDTSHAMSQRPKHKKEKFIPSAPGNPTTEDSLLQPIVNTTGIISGGKGGALRGSKRSRFGVGAFTGEVDNSKVYFDKTRPLAEQIAEREKPKVYNPEPAAGVPSVEVIGVRFREAGKVYYFAPGNNKVERGEAVIVETMRGSSSVVEYGFCAIGNRRVAEDEIVAPLKPIVRKATKEDTERYLANKQLEESAAEIFKEKVAMLKLEMSLVYVEYTFDNSKLLFYFTADGRVDFRELIKELASAFRTRIELRQIGVRDEAKAVGGLGICGRPVCCKSFLGEFAQVSIRMAKDQNLILNSSKISGTCGRFMCCIRYEDEVYQKEYEKTPKPDAIVETPDGRGIVTESNALKGTVKVLLDNEPDSVPKPYKSSEVKLLGYTKRDNKSQLDDEAEELPEEN